jgi:hypothetical protein
LDISKETNQFHAALGAIFVAASNLGIAGRSQLNPSIPYSNKFNSGLAVRGDHQSGWAIRLCVVRQPCESNRP